MFLYSFFCHLLKQQQEGDEGSDATVYDMEPEMPFDDGVTMVFLNSIGRQEDVPNELTQFLRYVENSTWENAVTEDLKKLHKMVGLVKHDEEVEIRYMKFWEEREKIRREALEEGRAEERAETEKERARADEAEKRAAEAERKCAELQAIIDGRKA